MRSYRRRRPDTLILVGLVLALGLVLVEHVPNASAATFTVTSSLDEPDANPGDGLCMSAPSAVCTLRASIMEANAQGGSQTITLPAGTFKLTIPGANEDGGATGDLDVYANLTITGAGADQTIVDGNQLDRVLDIRSDASSVAILQISLINGSRGGVRAAGGPLTLTGVTIAQNNGNAGIDSPGTVTVQNSQIIQNIFEVPGGLAGGIRGSSVILQNSIVRENQADLAGGVRADALMLVDSQIIGNTATQTGGIRANRATLTNSQVTNNTGVVGGIEGGMVELTTSRVTKNRGGPGGIRVSSVMLTDSLIADNQGGGLIVHVQATVASSTISGNSATASGGGILLDEGATLTLTNSTISGNSAPTGGGIAQAGSATLHLLNSTIANNSASTNGSGLYKLAGSMDVRNTIIANNTGSPSCFRATPLVSLGFNIDSSSSCGFNGPNDLSNTDPKLGPLTDNGGPTQTMALLSGSPAIDRGSRTVCPATDQRGVARPQDGDASSPATCDIGAYEAAFGTTPPANTCSPRPPVQVTSAPDGAGHLRVTVTATGLGTPLSALHFGTATNAQIDAPGAPPGASGPFDVATPAGATSYTFVVRRATAGQGVQVPFTVADACGNWPTFVGGGPSAF